MMFGMHHSHTGDCGHFMYPYYLYRFPLDLLNNDERIIREGPARFRVPDRNSKYTLLPGEVTYIEAEGVLALTSSRLIFCILKRFVDPTEDVYFNAPVDAIKGLSAKGWGFSVLVVDTDTDKVTGLPRNEFFVLSASRWVETFRELQNERTREIKIELPRQSPQDEPQVDNKLEKVCLTCMGVVPEDAEVCPKCGAKF